VNIRELAKHLNISIGTVSRALNGRPYVDAKTRERVLAAAAEYGYSPNLAGRSLRQGTTGMVAMMLPTSDGITVADTIFMVVLEGLRRFFSAHKLDLLVLLADLDDKDFSYLRRVVDRGLVDGVIIADIEFHDPRIDYLLTKKLPFVAYGRSKTSGRYSWIDFDFEGASAAAVDRLVREGHRRIALGTVARDINYGSVVEVAFREAAARHGLPSGDELIVRIGDTEQGGYVFGDWWLQLDPRPAAAVLASERMAIGLYRRLAEAGLAVGRDLAVVAIVEEPTARFLRPQLTHFAVDLQGLGFRLGEALLQEMQDGRKPPVQELFPMQLTLGDSDSMRL
jgi:DNA-binding LacI/PurR family transcriptional regulator